MPSKGSAQGAVNTSSFVQVLGLGTDCGDCSPSVLLFFDKKRYVFNVGEGFQRFCVEHKIKLTKLTGLLLTRNSSAATGGLPGLCLTMSDSNSGGWIGGHTLSLHGPPGLKAFVQGLSCYVSTRQVGLQAREIHAAASSADAAQPVAEAQPVIDNDLVKITPVLLRARSQQPGNSVANSPAPKGPSTANGHAEQPFRLEPSSEAQAKRQRTEESPAVASAPESAVACYVCELPSIPGKFMPERAQALGVQRGPQWGKLKAGQPAPGADGRMVQPDEVTEASVPGPVALVIDCPSEDYFASLRSAPGLQKWTSSDPSPAVVVHIGPYQVVSAKSYQHWLEQFPDSTKHIMVNKYVTGGKPVLASSAALQAKLHLLHHTIFPLQQVGGHGNLRPDAAEVSLPKACLAGRNLVKFNLRPVAKQGIDEGETRPASGAAVVQDELRTEEPEVFNLLNSTRDSLAAAPSGDEAAPPCARPGARRDALEVVFLGTGAAIPSKYRNVTGMYLNLFQHGGAMLDCGEGSLGQLHRRFGTGIRDVLAGLKFVWISHMHADHHAGLPRLLSARNEAAGPSSPPLPVFGPWPLQRVLTLVSNNEHLNYSFIDCCETLPLDGGPADGLAQGDSRAAVADVCKRAGLARLQSIRVEHCAQAFGVVLEGLPAPAEERGWKVAFSGDTRPCQAVVDAARGADLLVHEATFEDALESEALAKRHSLTREAVQTGQQCGAYRTLLTHFSQRYPKIPVFDASFAASTCIAFDLMTVNLADLSMLPKLLPALQQLFKDQAGAEDEPLPIMLS